jgi:hypothetical protein
MAVPSVERAFKNLGRFGQTMYECGYKPLLRHHKDCGEKWEKDVVLGGSLVEWLQAKRYYSPYLYDLYKKKREREECFARKWLGGNNKHVRDSYN